MSLDRLRQELEKHRICVPCDDVYGPSYRIYIRVDDYNELIQKLVQLDQFEKRHQELMKQ